MQSYQQKIVIMSNFNICAIENFLFPLAANTSRTHVLKESIKHSCKIEKFIHIAYPMLVYNICR